MYDERVKALRCCIVDFNSTQSRRCNECPYRIYADGKKACENKAKRDAADAIEKLMAEIDHKDKVIKDMLTTLTGMKDKLIDRICENCDTPPETRLRLCGECPIISPIREAFDEQP